MNILLPTNLGSIPHDWLYVLPRKSGRKFAGETEKWLQHQDHFQEVNLDIANGSKAWFKKKKHAEKPLAFSVSSIIRGFLQTFFSA